MKLQARTGVPWPRTSVIIPALNSLGILRPSIAHVSGRLRRITSAQPAQAVDPG
jgi:hypothetical protein